MRHYLLLALIAVTVSFGFAQISFAVCGGATPFFFCDANPPNPDLTGIQESSNDADLTVDILPGAEIEVLTMFGRGVDTGGGNDVVTVTDAVITAESDPIEVRTGNNTVTIIRSILSGGGDGVDSQFNNDIVTVTDSRITTNGTVIIVGSGDDEVTVTRSVLRRISESETSNTIDLGGGNDIITLNTGADISKVISCARDFDTIVFAMDVPEERLNFFSSQIAQATLPNGSVTIDGLTYNWTDCELLVNELVGVRVTRPIPTLSQWGLIAMAGTIGLAGFIAVRRKNVTV